jgi:hypothetical protein
MSDFKKPIRRKAVQICAVEGELFALCDDGTIWRTRIQNKDSWARVADVPDGIEQEDEQ